MKKDSSQSKTISSVKKQKIMVCPNCGKEGQFHKKEGFSLLGQKNICDNCGWIFKKPNLIRAKTTDVKIDKHGSAYKGRGKKFGRKS